MKKHLFIGLLLLLLLSPQSVGAFSISPLKYTVTIDPGKIATVYVNVKNDSAENKNYQLKVLGAKQDENGQPIFGENYSEAEKWVAAENSLVTVPSQSEKTFNFNISPPANAYPGFYFLGLAVEEQSVSGAQVGLSSRLLTLLSLQVAGTAGENLKIEKFSNYGFFKFTQKLNFALSLKNLGNVDLPLAGQFLLRNSQGQVVYKKSLNLGNNLIPGAIRNLQIGVEHNARLASGLYKAEIKIDYGRTRQNAFSSTNFVYVSYWLFALVILGFIFLFFLIKFLIKRRKL